MMKWLVRFISPVLSLLLLSGCGGGPVERPPAPFARGVWDGDVYTSEFARLTFSLPDGWEYSTDKELAASMKIKENAMAAPGEPFTEEMLSLEEIADMQAVIPDTSNLVIVGYTNLTMIDGGVEFTEDDFLEYEKEQSRGPDGELSFVFGEYNRVKTINGRTYTILDASFEDYDFSMHYMARRIGDYMLVVAIAVTEGESADDILAHFS